MSTPPIVGENARTRFWSLLRSTAKNVGLLTLVAAVAAGAAYGVFQWLIKAEQQDSAAQVAALGQELRSRQDQLDEKMAQVEQAASAARLLLAQNGATTTLDAKLGEIDTLKLDLKKTQNDMDTKLRAMEQSVVDEVARQGKETAQALSLELKWKNLVVKAQGEVLLAQVFWAEANRGLAKDELANAGQTLRRALELAPDNLKPPIKEAVTLAEQATAALILEQSSARDSLNLLWHKVGDLLAPGK